VYELESGRAKLFDLERDPRETSDLSTREALRASWYGEAVRELVQRAEALYRTNVTARGNGIPASLGEQIFGPRIVLQPVAQLVYEGTKVFDLSAILGTPYRAQEARMRQRNAGVRHQVCNSSRPLE
jgi:hypothetical protein